jgi:CubicO group peptidase (beta-lactamase class C family)
MKQSFFILFLLVYTLCFSQNEQADKLAEYFKNVPNKTQLSVAVIQNGIPEYFGVIKENDSLLFVENKDKLYEIGSITKVFTATILAQLISEGKIKPTTTVNQYFKFGFNEKAKIKLTELANHTSGMPRLPANFVTDNFIPSNPYKNYTPKDLEYYLKNELRLLKAPGTIYEYSNLGAGLLGYTLGISQKSSYSELLQTFIFERYHLTNTFVSKENIGERQLVIGLDEKGNETSNWDFDVLSGGGCIISCTEDLVKFALEQFDSSNKGLALTHIPTFTISDNMKIGIGWHIVTSLKTQKEYSWHNGGTGGYSSSMALDLSAKNGVIILSNTPSPNGEIDKLCFDFLEIID